MPRRPPEICPARRPPRGVLCGGFALLLAAGCTGPGFEPLAEEGAGDRPEVIEILGGAAASDTMPRELHFVVPPAPEPDRVAYALPMRTIFLNRGGGTYAPGYENSSTNASSIPYYTSTVSGWSVGTSTWNGLVECVRDQFAAFNVQITDTDPGAAPHIEAVIGGYPEDLQLPSSVGGASPFASDCSFIERSIIFVFPDVWSNDQRIICEVIAHEIGHSIGLDHEYLCADPMTYLEGCGNKSFQNTDAYCGEYYPTSCYCSATQNSFAILNARLGPADANAPAVAITSPSDGQVVAPGFAVEVAASDDVGVTQVELYVDGGLTATLTGGPYHFATNPSLADGTHVIETRAYDSKHVSSASIAVDLQSQEEPPDPPEDPGDEESDPPTTPSPAGTVDPPQTDLWKGCAAGGSNGDAPIWLIAVLGLAMLRRRKRT